MSTCPFCHGTGYLEEEGQRRYACPDCAEMEAVEIEEDADEVASAPAITGSTLPAATLADRVRYWRGAFDLTARAAVALVIASNFAPTIATGNGNAAARRQAEIETAAWFDAQGGLTEAEVNDFAEEYAERAGDRRMLARHVNFHD